MLLAGEQCPKCGGPATIAPFIDADGKQTSEVILHNGCPDPECETPDDPPTVAIVEIEVEPNGEPIIFRAETHPACWDRYLNAPDDADPPVHDWQLDEELLDEEAPDEELGGEG